MSMASNHHIHNGISSEERFLRGVTNEHLKHIMKTVFRRDGHELEFLNAVHEAALSLQPLFEESPHYLCQFERLCEPERTIIFRVPWLDDTNALRVNRGMRVQGSSALGPYKGGCRFHPTFNLSIAKMLAFEQAFKNSLTTLPLGAGKGGADFDPKGKSDGEIQRFCQSFMTELHRHIDDDIDVPAGDIGVGVREIGYLFGQYKRITRRFNSGVLTGKGIGWGGSFVRPEATGYGVVFIAEDVLADMNLKLQGKRCLVSGAGNVALYCAYKLAEEGAIVLTVSDSKGCLVEPNGFTADQIQQLMAIKSDHNGQLTDFKSPTAQYHGDRAKPWQLNLGQIDCAFPCATQNELEEADAKSLKDRGCFLFCEGANMPCTADAAQFLHDNKITFVPGKMANAGGVAVSGLEMAQNKSMMSWKPAEVVERLRDIMADIYKTSKVQAEKYNVNLSDGGNIAGFIKIADAMAAQGAV